MSMTALELMAQAIMSRLRDTAPGHCARVDYFDRQRSSELCDAIDQQFEGHGIALYILASSPHDHNNPRYISIDHAIELRNRKLQRLCLFVPSDLVDAAFSSLANSFAPIDGGQIQREAIQQLYNGLNLAGQNKLRAVLRVLKPPLRLSLDRQLRFYAAVAQRDQAGTLDHVGTDLWQVGLIADSGDSWIDRLNRNRTATIRLSLPSKIQSSTVERVDSLGVDLATRSELIRFLQAFAVNDVPTWSRALSERPDITFDHWVFPQEDPSDLVSVIINPFVNAQGVLEKYSNLKQPDGPNGLLYAAYGPKQSVTVKWKSDPPKPMQLHRWRVELVPANDYIPDEDNEIDFPMREISATRRSLTLNLDMDLTPDDLPEYPICVRVTPLDKSGNALRVQQDEVDQEPVEIIAYSQEFYLSNDPTPPKPVTITSTRRITPTIAFGRIEALLDMKSKEALVESDPKWNATHTNFSLRVSDRRLVSLGLSPLLVEIEQRVLSKPAEASRYVASIAEVRSLVSEDVITQPPICVASEMWSKWTSARKSFLEALARQAPRNLVATADWKELAETARRYGDVYQQLLTNLIEQNVAPTVIRDLICTDTLHIRVQGRYGVEDALIVLPTHPVRAAWMASYTQLLRHWEDTIRPAQPKERKTLIDLDLLRALEPANVPPFFAHPERTEMLLSAGNLGFFYGVYLPEPLIDSERRIAELSLMLSLEQVGSLTTSDMLAAQLTKHLKTFQELHPYVDTLVLSLVQMHNSSWISEALNSMANGSDENEDASVSLPPTLALTGYVAHPETVTGISGIDRLRQIVNVGEIGRETTHLLPAVSSAIAPLDKLLNDEADEAHLAIIGDLAIPRIVPTAAASLVSGAHSLSVYGLVVRLISVFTPHAGELRWTDMVALPDTLPHEHPVAPRYGKTLLDLYRVMQRAGGSIIANASDQWPAVTYTIEQQQRQMIIQTHAHAHWVITADRFFALDYYDSPLEPALREQSRTYLIDYAPEFVDGIGQRMFITTRWRDEVEMLLTAAMQELGFDYIDQSVGQLLNILKTISGQLALHLTRSTTSAAAAVGMGVVTAYLKQRKELENAVLIPVDSAPRLVSRTMAESVKKGERRCDMLLLAIKRNTIEITFIEVKWRRGTSSFDSLATEMETQMRLTAESVRSRYFRIDGHSKESLDERADGVLQRAYFANIVRFYAARAHRYGLLTDDAYKSFTDNLRGIERPSYEFHPKYHGFIVTLEKKKAAPINIGDAVIDVITASDIEEFETRMADSAVLTQTQINEEIVVDTSPSILSSQAPKETLPLLPEMTDSARRPTETPFIDSSEQPGPTADVSTDGQVLSEELTIPLGETSRGPVTWKPSVRGSPHLFIIGIPGQGKSVTTNHILVELARQHVPSLVLDFHGQFADLKGPFLAASGSRCVNAAEGIPFSPFEVMVQNGKNDWKQNSAALADIFAYVVGLGGIQKDLLQNAIQDAYKACGYGTGETSGRAIPTTEEVLRNIEQREQKQKVRNVAARCRPLLEMDLFNSVEREASLLSQIRKGLVIDLHELMSETLQLAVGAFVLRKLYRDMFAWGQANSLRLAIVLDEAHRLAKDVTLPKLMKEGRKYGIAVVVASQGLSDFRMDVLGNAGTKVIFRTNYPESRKIAPYVEPRNTQDVAAQIEQLKVGTALVQTPEMQKGVVVHMYSSEL